MTTNTNQESDHDQNPSPEGTAARADTRAERSIPLPPIDVAAADAAANSIAVVRSVLGTLEQQRVALAEQIGRLEADLESKRSRALEEHTRQLAAELRNAQADHAKQIAALIEQQEKAAKEWRTLEAKCAAERLRHEEDVSSWSAKARARVETELEDARKACEKQVADRRKAVEAELAAKLGDADTAVAARRSAAESELADLRKLRMSDLEVREVAVKAQAEAAAKAVNDAAATNRRAQADIAIAAEDRERAREAVAEALEKNTRAYEQRLSAKQSELDREIRRSEARDAELQQLREIARSIGSRTAEEVLCELEKAQKAEASLRRQLADRPTKEDCQKLDDEIAALRKAAEQSEKERSELSRLRAQKAEWTRTASQQQDAEQQRQIEQTRRVALEGHIEKLTVEVNRLRALHERSQEMASRVREINSPVEKRRDPARNVTQEMPWLASIEKQCRAAGVIFPRRLLHSFHTALKTAEWSPITVLSGVSGTGKSDLPKRYARYGGLNFRSVPVQPNWDSPEAAFGFFNSIANKFNASPLLRLLVQSARAAGEGDGLNDQMSLILLDEMNLAHVELYFSDMLSKLEDRRGDRRLPALEIDIGADADRLKVPLDRNVLWCGTMNEDETTKTLSDKVLDRGNMLVFPRPTELLRRIDPAMGDEAQPLPRKVWESWTAPRSPFTDQEVAEHKKILEEMSQHMESVGRAIGHRVWQSVEYYMANHPLVRHAQVRADGDLLEEAMFIALEDQVVLKVMPKLRGIETRGMARRNCLDPIAKIVDEKFPAVSEDFRAALENGSDSFMWRSAHYLKHYVSPERYQESKSEPAPESTPDAKTAMGAKQGKKA